MVFHDDNVILVQHMMQVAQGKTKTAAGAHVPKVIP